MFPNSIMIFPISPVMKPPAEHCFCFHLGIVKPKQYIALTHTQCLVNENTLDNPPFLTLKTTTIHESFI